MLWRVESFQRDKHRIALFHNPNQDVRTTMQGDFECLLGEMDSNTSIRKSKDTLNDREEPLDFKDSNLRLDSMMKAKTMSTPRRRLQDATLKRRSLILNKIDATRCKLVGPKTGWILLKQPNIWPVVWPMSKLCEFVCVPMKHAARDSVAQIGNHTSKSEASIQSGTALNPGETENSVTDHMEARRQSEYKDMRDFLGTRTSSRRRCQYQKGEELRKCCNKADSCFCTTMLFKSKDWYSTGHGSHTPLQDDGDKSMMDLAPRLQT